MTARILRPGSAEERLFPGDFGLSFFILPVSLYPAKKQIIPAAAAHRNDPSGRDPMIARRLCDGRRASNDRASESNRRRR